MVSEFFLYESKSAGMINLFPAEFRLLREENVRRLAFLFQMTFCAPLTFSRPETNRLPWKLQLPTKILTMTLLFYVSVKFNSHQAKSIAIAKISFDVCRFFSDLFRFLLLCRSV